PVRLGIDVGIILAVQYMILLGFLMGRVIGYVLVTMAFVVVGWGVSSLVWRVSHRKRVRGRFERAKAIAAGQSIPALRGPIANSLIGVLIVVAIFWFGLPFFFIMFAPGWVLLV